MEIFILTGLSLRIHKVIINTACDVNVRSREDHVHLYLRPA